MLPFHKTPLLALAAAVIIFSSGQARAVDKIYSPHTEQGEWELEYFGARTFDNAHNKNDIQSNEYSVGYGVNSFWWAEIYGIFEKQPDQSSKATGWQTENRFQLAEQGEYWVDPGLLLAYTYDPHKKDPDKLEARLLLEKQVGKFLHRANIGIEQELGSNRQGGPDRVFLWSSRYRYDARFEPGLEVQSDFGKANDHLNLNKQLHYAGPAAYGEIVPHLKYEAAYLVGLTNGASQSAARFLIEYEMRF